MGDFPENDEQFEEQIIKKVEAGNDGSHFIGMSSGWSIFVPAGDVTPKRGDIIRLYGRGTGYRVRGVFINGQRVYYRSEAEDEQHHKDEIYGRDAPDLLQRWDAGKGVFTIEMGGMGPGYEQAIQVFMFEVLRFLLAEDPGADVLKDDWSEWREKISAATTEAASKLGLSGAQYAAAVSLASAFYMRGPQAVLFEVDSDRRIQVSRAFPSLAA